MITLREDRCATWIQRMRDEPNRQIRDKLTNGRGGFCATGLALDVLVQERLFQWALPGMVINGVLVTNPILWGRAPVSVAGPTATVVEHHFGIPAEWANIIIHANDGGVRFHHLADLIEQMVTVVKHELHGEPLMPAPFDHLLKRINRISQIYGYTERMGPFRMTRSYMAIGVNRLRQQRQEQDAPAAAGGVVIVGQENVDAPASPSTELDYVPMTFTWSSFPWPNYDPTLTLSKELTDATKELKLKIEQDLENLLLTGVKDAAIDREVDKVLAGVE